MIAPVSFFNKYLSSISAGQNIMDLGDVNASLTLVNLTQTSLSFALDPKRNSLYRCTSTTSDGAAIITIPTIWETAESQFDGRSFGVLFLLHHAGSINDAAQTDITIRSEKQGRTIATLKVGSILAMQYSSSNRLNASVSPTENIPASTGYIIYNVAGRGLPSNGEEGDLLVLNEDGEAIWQSPFSTNGMLPQDGEPGEILVRTADGAGWEALPEDELPPGGDTGDVLTRTEAGSEWLNLPDEELPPGGEPGDILTRTSDGSSWSAAPAELPSGGDALQVLTRTATGYEWRDRFPGGNRDQFLGTNFNGDVAFRNLPNQLPSGGDAGEVLTRTATGYEWGTIEAAPDELPAGGEAGNILTRTDTGSEWSPAPTEIPSGGTTTQVLTRTAGGYEWRNVFPTGTNGQALITNFAGVPAFRNLPVELPPGGDEGQVLTRVGSGGRQWADLPDAEDIQGAEGNPKLQTRTFQTQATGFFPLLPGAYTVTTNDDDTSTLRIGFPASEEHLVFNLRADVREVNLYRQGEPHTRIEIDLDNKFSVVHQLVAGDPTSEIRFLEVSAPTDDFATWLATAGDATFYIQGELNPTELLTTEEASAQARISSLNDTTFVLRFNRNADRLGLGKNGNTRANMWVGNRNLIYQPSDEVYARIVEAVGEGRLDSITVRANALGSTSNNIDLSAVARTDTYPIDNITFLSDAERLTNGNRIDIRLRDIVDPTWLNQAQTRFFVLSFNVLTPQLSDNFASYRYFRVSRNMASATDRVANVGVGGINLDGTDTGGGVIFSANPEEQDALIAENFVLGDFVELIGHTSDDVSIPGAYLKWDNFTLTLLPDVGQARVESPSSLPRAFLDATLDKISIRLFPGSAAEHEAAVESIIKRESAYEFAWVVKKNGVDPIRNRKEIRWGFNSLKFSKEGNRSTVLKGSHLEPGDNITLTPHTFDGTWIDSYSLNVSNWNFFDNESSNQYFEIGRTGNERPFNDTSIRAADILKVQFHPGSKKIREQALLVNESGLFYQGKRLSQAPTATIFGIYPDAVNRTITHTVNGYERERIIEENLGEGDLMELTAFNNGFERTKREFKHLASAPDFSVTGNVSLTFLDSDPELSIEFGRSANLQVLLSKVASEGEAPLETFRTTTTVRTSVTDGDADAPGTFGFFNPANFGADDINRVMQLIEPISELGVYQTELENINRVEFRTEGATPEIYEFLNPPFITNSNGPDGQVTYIQLFFTRVVHANFRDATGSVFLTFLGEEDLRARNLITALTARVDTNAATAETNATAHAANALAIAANSDATDVIEPKVESLEVNTRNLPFQNEFTNSFRLLPKVSATTFDSLLGEQNTARWNSDGTALQFRTADNEEDGFFNYLQTIAGSDTAFKNVVATLLVGSELHRFDLTIDSDAAGSGWGGEGSSTIIQFTARNDGTNPSLIDITTSVGVISIQFSVAKKISKVLERLENSWEQTLIFDSATAPADNPYSTLTDYELPFEIDLKSLFALRLGTPSGTIASSLFSWEAFTTVWVEYNAVRSRKFVMTGASSFNSDAPHILIYEIKTLYNPNAT